MKYNLNIKVNNNLSDLLIGYSCQGWLDNNAKVYKSVLVDKDDLVSDGDDYKAVVEIDINNTVINGKTYKFNMQCAKCNNKEGVKVLWYVIPTNDASVYSEDDRMFFKNNVAEDASTGSYVIPKVNIVPFRFIQELYVEAPIKSMRLYNPDSFGNAGDTFTVVKVQYKYKNDNTTYSTTNNHVFTIETDTHYAVCNDFENSEQLMCNSKVITSFNPSAKNSFDDPDTYGHPYKILIQKQDDDDVLYLKPNAIVIDFVPFKTMFPSIESEEPDSYGVLAGKFNDEGIYSGYIKESDYDSLTNVSGSYPKKYEDSVNHITVYFKVSQAQTEETKRGYVCNSAQSWQYKRKGYNGNPMYDFSSLDTLPQYPLVNCLNGTVKPCIKQVSSTTDYIDDIVGPKDNSHMKHYIYGYSGSVEARKYNRW